MSTFCLESTKIDLFFKKIEQMTLLYNITTAHEYPSKKQSKFLRKERIFVLSGIGCDIDLFAKKIRFNVLKECLRLKLF